MQLKNREKIWAYGLGAVVGVWALFGLYDRTFRGPAQTRRDKIALLDRKIDRSEQKIQRAERAAEKLRQWNACSLPADTELARSLYQNWLVEIVERAGFEKPNVDSGEAVSKSGVYRRLPFSIRGRGKLEDLVKFLYDFYCADHLHQIQRLTIVPVANSQVLELSLAVEALVLPNADSEDELSDRRSNRLAFDSFVPYRTIHDRNVFGEGGVAALDASDFAFLTAILTVDGQPEAWFTLRTTGEVLKLRVGESFEVGQFRGAVAEIDQQDLVIQSDDERWLVSLGENLGQASALPPEY